MNVLQDFTISQNHFIMSENIGLTGNQDPKCALTGKKTFRHITKRNNSCSGNLMRKCTGKCLYLRSGTDRVTDFQKAPQQSWRQQTALTRKHLNGSHLSRERNIHRSDAALQVLTG
jgi:hypothetical protein